MRCSSFIAVVLHRIPLLMVQGKGNNGKKRKHKYNIPKVYINGFSNKYFLKFFFSSLKILSLSHQRCLVVLWVLTKGEFLFFNF